MINLFGASLGEAQQANDDQQRRGDEETFVPATLMGDDCEGHSADLAHDQDGPKCCHGQRFYGGVCFNGSRSITRSITMRAQVEECIEIIRPALQADGGDIELKDVDEVTGVVSVTLVGACGTCPASTQTLKAGIERIMRDRVDGVTEVVAV